MQALRRCSYTGWLYCADCYTGDTAALPAAVLHAWDFSRRPVCCSAAAFLEAIQAQPMLTLESVPPLLAQRCPELLRAHELRNQACRALQGCASSGTEQVCFVQAFLRVREVLNPFQSSRLLGAGRTADLLSYGPVINA